MSALGIDLKLLLAQIVNFVVLFLLLRKFLYKPITKILDERKEKITQGIKDAEASAAKLAKAEKDADKISEKAYEEANAILKSAKNEANQEASEIIKKATASAQKAAERIAEEKAAFKGNALAEAKKEMGDMVILALDKIVGDEIDNKTKDELTAKAISDL